MSKLTDYIDKRQFATTILVTFVIFILTYLATWLLKLEFLRTLYILDKIYIFLFVFVITWLFLIHKKAKKLLSIPIEKIVEDKIASKGIIKALDKCDKDIREIRQSLSQIYDKAKQYESIQPDEVIEFFLSKIGGKFKNPMSKDELYRHFRAKYRTMPDEEATFLFNRKIYFSLTRNIIDHFEESGKIHYRIKNFGYEYIETLEAKRKNGEI